MQLSNIPAKIAAIFAASAPTGYKNTIPLTQAGIAQPGEASYDVGFPSVTMQPAASGGINPYGQDFNGLGFALSGPLQWVCAGGTFPFDSAFASTIGGYPKGAILQNATGDGFWLNLAENNSANPDTGGTNWAPLDGYGITAVTGLTNANVTLSAPQYSKKVITLSGTLTGNVQIIFPTTLQQWLVVNNTTGSFTVTCKTSAGTGSTVPQGGQQSFWGDGTNLNQGSGDARYLLPANVSSRIQPLTASVAANALTASYAGGVLDFRSATLTTGTPNASVSVPANSITVPSGATLGTVSGQQSQIVIVEYYNGGSPVAGVINLAGGAQLDETNLVSPTTISSGATSASTFYSASAVTGPTAYRVVGVVTSTQATAGTWATAPSQVQGAGGLALANYGSLGMGQAYQELSGSRVLGTTYYNTSGRARYVTIYMTVNTGQAAALMVNGVQRSNASNGSGNNTGGTVSAVIPPGASYSLTLSGGSVNTWNELG